MKTSLLNAIVSAIFILSLSACEKQKDTLVNEAVPASITGTISYRERIALSPEATIEVSLQDVSLADVPAKVLSKQKITHPGQVPVHFELSYRREDINQRFTYAIRARITEGDHLMFINDTHTPVLTRGAGNHVDMMLVRVQPSSSADGAVQSDPPLLDTYWNLLELQGAPVVTPEGMREAHFILTSSESRTHGFSGCNNFFGSYKSDGDSLSFSALGSTMMACAEGMETETGFFDALGKTNRFKISGQFLQIYADDHLLARFEAVSL